MHFASPSTKIGLVVVFVAVERGTQGDRGGVDRDEERTAQPRHQGNTHASFVGQAVCTGEGSEGVVPGQVFVNRRTSLRAASSSQVFVGSRGASEDKSPGQRPVGDGRAGHAFKTGVPAKAGRRVRFPSASALRSERTWGTPGSTFSHHSRLARALPSRPRPPRRRG